MKVIILAVSLCFTASANIVPITLFSGDATGWNYQPGVSGSTSSPNIIISDAQAGLILPDGISAVSFSATANAPNGTIVGYVDQWQTIGPTSITLNWWASGPTMIWFDGGTVGMLVDSSGTGEQSGTLNLMEDDGNHYFAAYVTASDFTNSFAYYLVDPPNVPEPGTLSTLALGLGVVFGMRKTILATVKSRVAKTNL